MPAPGRNVPSDEPAIIDLRTPAQIRRRAARLGQTPSVTDRPLAPTAPRPPPFEPDLLTAAARADAAVAELEAKLRSLPEGVRLDGFLLREAVATAHEEGQDVPLWDMFRYRSGSTPDVTPLAPDVERHIEAVSWAINEVTTEDLNRRVLTELVDRRRTRGRGVSAKSTWARGRRATVPTAATGPVTSPALRAALAREIVETSWPDDSSRLWLARTAVALSLAHDGALTTPLIDVSSEASRLVAPGVTGAPDRAGVHETVDRIAHGSNLAIRHLERLVRRRESYLEVLARGRPSRAPALVDLLVANPVITAQFVADQVGLTHQGGLNLIRRFEQKEWVKRIKSSGRGGRKYWIAPDLLAIFESDFPSNQPFSSPDTEEHT